MASFVAVYHGDSIASARLIAVSADPHLVREVTNRILQEPQQEEADPVVATLECGRRAALRLIREALDTPTRADYASSSRASRRHPRSTSGNRAVPPGARHPPTP